MADFEAGYSYLLDDEDRLRTGEVTHDPTQHDPNAIARFGINSAAHPEAVKAGFYQMPEDQALAYCKELYHTCYWLPIQGDQIVSQDVANKLFSMSVNRSPHSMTEIMQETLRELGVAIPTTGFFGPMTLAAVNNQAPEVLLIRFKYNVEAFYRLHAPNWGWSDKTLESVVKRIQK